jgi:signal transduction histidine kinase
VNRSLRLPALVVGVAVAVLLLASAFGSWRVAGLRWAIPTAIGTTCASVGATMWVRYRSTADPHALFVAVGFSVVALQILGFAVAWPGLVAETGFADAGPLRRALEVRAGTLSPAALGAYATQVGWLVGGACFVLARPWWERRGRPPVRAAAVYAAAAGLALVLDAAVIALDPADLVSRASERGVSSAGFATRVGLGPTGAVLLIVALALLGAAVARELQTPEGGPSIHPWLATAFTVAAIGLVVSFARPLPFEASLRAVDLIPLIAPIIASAGLLATQRAEVSHMRRASDRAEEVLGGRAEIASMISHEIRGPVTTIRGLASTGDRHWDKLSEAERREFLRLIDQESGRLLRIADQTSTALKVDADTLPYALRPSDLAEVVREAVEKTFTGEHPVTLDLEPGIALPLDRIRFADAVTELVENAATFSPEDAPIEVRARADAEAGTVVVEIVDHGPGIPLERREAAFGKFPGFRPPGYEEAPGTGLGLFICRAHVHAHGGEVAVTETSDGSTMLRITLPNQGEEEHGR